MLFGSRDFNTLIHFNFSKEWEQIYQYSPETKTTEGNSAVIYFSWTLYESVLQSIFFISSFSWFKKFRFIYVRSIATNVGLGGGTGLN